MDFVNAQRRTQRIAPAALLHPVVVGPLEFLRVPNDRGGLGGQLEQKTVGISFSELISVLIANLELVQRAFGEARHEQFPYPGSAQRTHGVEAAIPIIEIANNTHPRRVWGPHRETNAGHAV